MAILEIERHWVGQLARRETNGESTLTMKYQVICDSIEPDTDLQILDDPRIPSTGDSVTLRGTEYFVQSVATEPPDANNRLIWGVTVDFTDTLGGGSGGGDLDQAPGGQKPNPVDDDPMFDFDSGDGVRFRRTDTKGDLIVNTAGDPPEPVQVFDPHPVVNYTRNQSTFSWDDARKYVAHVNKDTWNGAQPGEILCRRIRAQRRWRNKIPFWVVTYQFEAKGGWQFDLVSLGLRQKSKDANGNDTLVPIYVNGVETQVPMMLDSDGAYTDDPANVDTTTWNVYYEVDFGPLNINLRA